jgi:hypothetical protein
LQERLRGRLFQPYVALDLEQKSFYWNLCVLGHRDDRRANEEPSWRGRGRLGDSRFGFDGGRLLRASRRAECETRDRQPE